MPDVSLGTLSLTSTFGGAASVLGTEDCVSEPDKIAPPCGCGCDCGCSSRPIRYVNGEVQLSAVDLAGGGFGSPWSVSRVYSNQLRHGGNFGLGHGWFMSSLPYLKKNSGTPTTYVFIASTHDAVWFDDNSGTITARYGAHHALSIDSGNSLIKVATPAGEEWHFHDFTQSTYPKGSLKKHVSQGGVETSVVSYDGNNHPTEIQRAYTSGGSTTTESFKYDYYTSGDNSGMVEFVTLRRKVDAGAWTEFRRAKYEYYAASVSHGSVNDLKRVTLQALSGSTWTDVDVSYYRYWKDGDAQGGPHDLKFVVNSEAYKRLDDAVSDPLTATDTEVADFADHYFEYDAAHRAVKEKTDGGSQTFTFAFTTSGHSDDPNNWKRKTVETLPDGVQKIVYTNFLGQPLIEETVSGSENWIEYHKYNADARQIQPARPSAVTSYADTSANLGVTLKSSDGLIHVTDYYGTTGGGAAKGHEQFKKIKKGSTGTEIKLRAFEYTSRSAGIATIYPVSKSTLYKNDDNTGPVDTSFAYAWHTGTVQMQERTTTLPVISSGQNGSGSANSRVERFDLHGNFEWLKDERGFITRHVYDLVKGGLTQTIEDVDTTQTSDEPSGWSTPSGGGLHLISDFELDDLGRVTQVLGSIHSVDLGGTATNVRRAAWTVHKDIEHEIWTAQGYASGSGYTTFTLVNPVSITKLDRAGRVVDQISATRASTSGKLLPTDTFAQSTWVRWTSHAYTDEGDLSYTRVYHSIPSSGSGSSGTNYDQTDFGYDASGRQNKVKTPGGTITRTTFDARGNAKKTYQGTNDTGATDADPTGGGAGGNNMVLVAESAYDGGMDGGDNNLTAKTAHVDGSTTRATAFGFDWRNRQTSVDGEVDLYVKHVFDNRGLVTRTDRHDTTSGGNLVARRETSYDDLGRAYQQKRYAVARSTGTAGNPLTGNTWRDAAGNVIKEKPAGSAAFTKTQLDGIGRPTKQFVGFDTAETTYADADDVAGDTIFEQVKNDYDPAGNVILITTYRRHHDATGTGELSRGTQPKARISYVAFWHDPLGRLIATANYGTNGDADLTRPSTIPARSDNVLVTTIEHNSDGEAYKTIDPAGKEDRQEFRDDGRVTKTIENYVDGDPTTGNADQDRTVEFTYNADALISTIKAKQQSAANDQLTTFVYGTTLSDSDVALSNLLRAIIYPDSDDVAIPLGNGADGVYDRIEFKYNRQSERKEMKDQNGNIHAYDRDKLARLIHDRITTLGSGVDGAVRRLSFTYMVLGMMEKATSHDNATVGSGSVVNEVQAEYNDFAQLKTEWQQHDAAVNTSTSPKVQYAYSDGSANHIRPTQVTYPNGRILHIGYNSGADDNLSRVSFFADDSSGSPGTHLADYVYLGLRGVAQVDYTEPDLRYDLAHGSGSNVYAGWDRFDRVVDLLWRDYGASADAERIKHGYDRASNRLWREAPVPAALSTPVHLDELYGYDGAYQLQDFDRGDLNSTKDGISSGTLKFAQEWILDMLGNWGTFKEDADGNGTFELNQSRAHSKANEITQIDSSSTHIAHDKNGNSTKVPKPDNWSAHFDLTYDAWNRFVKAVDGSNTVSENDYDAKNRRTLRKGYISGTLDHTRHFYYSANWQVLEERLNTSSNADRQFVWGLRYVDDLILRDRDTTVPADGTLNERLYALQDGNWNLTAIADTAGVIVERFSYSAYGTALILTPAFASRSSSSFAWEIRFAGYRWEDALGWFHVRNREFLPMLGRWSRRDPADHPSSNLYAYVEGHPLAAIDPTGKNLYAIDGTWTKEQAKEKSNVAWLKNLADEKVKYHAGSGADTAFTRLTGTTTGPFGGAFGTDSYRIMNRVWNEVCEDWCAAVCDKKEITINLLGWSRGAIIAATVAQRLNDLGCICPEGRANSWRLIQPRDTESKVQRPIPVNWLGLFDAVSQHFLTEYRWVDTWPPNVTHRSHAVRTASQWQFPIATGFTPLTQFWRHDGTPATHGDIGMRRDNNDAHLWMYEEAKAAGVKLKEIAKKPA